MDLEICYDRINSKAIYAKYEIDGVSLKQYKTTIVPPRPTVNFNLYPDNIACYYTKVMTHIIVVYGVFKIKRNALFYYDSIRFLVESNKSCVRIIFPTAGGVGILKMIPDSRVYT